MAIDLKHFSEFHEISLKLFAKTLIVRTALSVAFMVLFFCVGSFAESMNHLLPTSDFLEGWSMEGKAETYSRENLYELINGEAELYLPYGFETLATVYFGLGPKAKTSLSVEVFKMGSLLDAFGIYSNYRAPDAESVKIGADGFVSESQLMFYQDRYFVRLSSSSSAKPDRKTFFACAETVSKNLSLPLATPKELELINIPGISPRTEKYVAESLIGYKFFQKGIVAEANLEGKPVKAFVVITESEAAASATLSLYVESLKKDGRTPTIQEGKDRTLTTQDPLYNGVVLRQSGRYLFGIAKLEDINKGLSLLAQWTSLH